MKFSRILWVVLLVGISSMVAKADGADPVIVLKIGNGSPDCPTGAGSSQSNPILLPDGSPFDCFYTGPPATIANIYIDVVPSSPSEDAFFESENFVCENGIASNCAEVSGAISPGLPEVEFEFFGPFTGIGDTIPSGEDLFIDEVSIGAPEPGSMVLLAFGLACLAGFGFKRRELIPS